MFGIMPFYAAAEYRVAYFGPSQPAVFAVIHRVMANASVRHACEDSSLHPSSHFRAQVRKAYRTVLDDESMKVRRSSFEPARCFALSRIASISIPRSAYGRHGQQLPAWFADYNLVHPRWALKYRSPEEFRHDQFKQTVCPVS